jgi:nucleoside-diphosphate-sugar epimerase
MLLRLDHGQDKSTAEAAVDAVRVILQQCAESKTVKRVIHTASMSTASPLKNGRWGSWSSRAVDLGCGGRGGRVGEEGGETRGRRSGAAAAALAREVGRPRGGWPRITTARCGSGPARPGARSRRPSGA